MQLHNLNARFNKMMEAIQALMGLGMSRFDAQQKVGPYKSRGHGRGVAGKTYRSHSKYAPHDGAKQAARQAKQSLHMTTFNGFELVQQAKNAAPAAERLAA